MEPYRGLIGASRGGAKEVASIGREGRRRILGGTVVLTDDAGDLEL